jgi:hypothetical protein
MINKNFVVMKMFCLLILAFSIAHSSSQNVGIGTSAPSEKLDVNGNINLSGTIKSNGIAGQNGQVLLSTGAGLSWGTLTGYKRSAIFTGSGTASWTIPAGVTEIMIEAWGAGAGGTTLTGGSSGGYARTTLTVTPGASVTINTGSGSFGAAFTTSSGGNTTASIGGITITATGAAASDWSNNSLNIGYPGIPGQFSISPSTTNLFGLPGQQGEENNVLYQQYAAGIYSVITHYGNGAPTVGLLNLSINHGDMTEYKAGAFATGHYSKNTYTPGGGGGGGTGSGYKGGDGMVVIWYN